MPEAAPARPAEVARYAAAGSGTREGATTRTGLRVARTDVKGRRTAQRNERAGGKRNRAAEGRAGGGPSLTRRHVRSDPGAGRQPALRPHAHKPAEKTTRVRTVLNEKQLHTLRTCYAANPRPDALMKEQLVEMTGLSPRVIRVWFQNKRCKDKKKSILMKQLQQQQHSDKTVSGRAAAGGVGLGLAPGQCAPCSPGGLGSPRWGTGLCRPRASAPAEQGFAWGSGLLNECI